MAETTLPMYSETATADIATRSQVNPMDRTSAQGRRPVYQRIEQVVSHIPLGQVATYGQIAAIVGSCTPRMVGYAMASLPQDSPVPWQRVINAQGKISPRADGFGSHEQRSRLEAEGIRFDDDRVDLQRYGWQGPAVAWLLEHGFDPAPTWSGQ